MVISLSNNTPGALHNCILHTFTEHMCDVLLLILYAARASVGSTIYKKKSLTGPIQQLSSTKKHWGSKSKSLKLGGGVQPDNKSGIPRSVTKETTNMGMRWLVLRLSQFGSGSVFVSQSVRVWIKRQLPFLQVLLIQAWGGWFRPGFCQPNLFHGYRG